MLTKKMGCHIPQNKYSFLNPNKNDKAIKEKLKNHTPTTLKRRSCVIQA